MLDDAVLNCLTCSNKCKADLALWQHQEDADKSLGDNLPSYPCAQHRLKVWPQLQSWGCTTGLCHCLSILGTVTCSMFLLPVPNFFTVVLGGSSLTEVARLSWATLFSCLTRLHSLSEHYHSFLYDLSTMLSLRIRWSLGYVEHGYCEMWLDSSLHSFSKARASSWRQRASLRDGFSVS